jgi:hypothetical protein
MGGYTQVTERDPITGVITGYRGIRDVSEGYKDSPIRAGVLNTDRTTIFDPTTIKPKPLTLGNSIESLSPGLPKDAKGNIDDTTGKSYLPASAKIMLGAWIDPESKVVNGTPYRTEGTYEKKGTFEATDHGGNKRVGTLWQSEGGAYQIVDPYRQVIMSGSGGAPLPKLDRVSEKDKDSLNNWGTPSWERVVIPPIVTPTAPTAPTAPSQPVVPTTVATQPSPPNAPQAPSPKSSAPNNNPYDLPGGLIWGETQNGMKIDPVSGYIAYTNGTFSIRGDPNKNLYKYNTTTNKIELASFGAPPKKSRKPVQRVIQKPIGFMDIFNTAKKQTTKPTKPIKKPIKKPISKKKEIGFDNAYEVLFSNKRRK